MEYTVASFDPATDTYTINSLEKVGKTQLEAVLQHIVAESSETLPPESYYGKRVRYKEVPYTVASFDTGTQIYTLTSVVKVEKDVLDQKREGSRGADGQGKRRNTGKLFEQNTFAGQPPKLT